MGKKTLGLPSLFRAPRKHPWQLQLLPSCGHSTKTLSFRGGDDIFKTVNSVFFDPIDQSPVIETPEPWFTTSSESAGSFSTESEGESLELLLRGVRSSERLFFEPGDTSSILKKAKDDGFPFKESVVLAIESNDPYGDFRISMEEMVDSHGLRDWEELEELLGWYLKVNENNNHKFIVGAFVDLLVSLSASSDYSCSDFISTSYSSAVSSVSSCSPLCLCEDQNEIVNEHEDTEKS